MSTYAARLQHSYAAVRSRLIPPPYRPPQWPIPQPSRVPYRPLRNWAPFEDDGLWADTPGGVAPPKRQLTFATIKEVVCRYYDASHADMVSRSRARKCVRLRHVAMYLGRELLPLSTPALAKRLGLTDHTTIIYGVRRLSERLLRDKPLAAEIAAIRELLAGYWEGGE